MPKVDFSKIKNQKHIAVGLSGGGDSMALTHMLSKWALQNNAQIHAITVNHNLRKNSANEAVMVGGYIKKFPNVEHHILKWDMGGHEKTALMEKARSARYALMIEYCKAHNIDTLAIGHHGDDQIETFLFRLSKGSGVDGLAAMPELSERDGVQIYRPLLPHSHHELIQYCKSNHLKWIEDPSNQNSQFARPRIRKALEDEGLTTKRMAKTVQRMAEAKEAILWLVGKAFDETNINKDTVQWDVLSEYPRAVAVRVLQGYLERLGKDTGGYPPKLERVESIVATIRPSKSATLHGCLITLSKDGKALEIKAV
jgi:tRNA(Ile)-lysidine synthase